MRSFASASVRTPRAPARDGQVRAELGEHARAQVRRRGRRALQLPVARRPRRRAVELVAEQQHALGEVVARIVRRGGDLHDVRAEQELLVEEALVLAPVDERHGARLRQVEQLRRDLARVGEVAAVEPAAARGPGDGDAVRDRLVERRVGPARGEDVRRVDGHALGELPREVRVRRDEPQLAHAAVGHRAARAPDVSAVERPDEDDLDVLERLPPRPRDRFLRFVRHAGAVYHALPDAATALAGGTAVAVEWRA